MNDHLGTIEVVYNNCYGGFGLSYLASRMLAERKGWELETVDGGWLVIKGTYEAPHDRVARSDPDLIAIVRELGEAANGETAKLKIAQLKVYWDITTYDGKETPGASVHAET